MCLKFSSTVGPPSVQENGGFGVDGDGVFGSLLILAITSWCEWKGASFSEQTGKIDKIPKP